MTLVQMLLSWLGLSRHENATDDELMRRRVMSLAWPAVLQGLLITSIQVVDTYLVSLISDEALAAVGTASQLIFVMLILLIAVEVGASVLVAQAVGAQDRIRANRYARQGITTGLLIAIPLIAFGFGLRHQLVGLFDLEPEVAALALDYWSIVAVSLVLLMLVFVLSGILRGAGDTRTPMLGTAVANVFNAGFGYVLIFGKLGFPEMGVAGSALASTIGWGSHVAFMVIVLLRGDHPVSLLGRRGWMPTADTVRGIVRIGAPVAGEETSWSFGLAVLTGVVATLGTAALAAHRIVFNALTLSFMPGLGLAMATTALVGQAVGARDPAGGRRALIIGSQYAAAWMGTIGLIYFFGAETIARLFSSDPEVIRAGAGALRALAVTQPIWALLLVFSGALRGTGKSVFPMVANSLMVWAAVGLAFLWAELDFGLSAVWLSFTLVAPLPVLALWRRLQREPLLTPGGFVPLADDLVEEPLQRPEPVGAAPYETAAVSPVTRKPAR